MVTLSHPPFHPLTSGATLPVSFLPASPPCLLPPLLLTNNFLGDELFGRDDAGQLLLPVLLLYRFLTTSLDTTISKRLRDVAEEAIC